MVKSVNQILIEARGKARTGKQRQGIPSEIYPEISVQIQALKKILEPIAMFTDEVQADTVTSSLVIVGVINVIKGELFFKSKLKFLIIC